MFKVGRFCHKKRYPFLSGGLQGEGTESLTHSL